MMDKYSSIEDGQNLVNTFIRSLKKCLTNRIIHKYKQNDYNTMKFTKQTKTGFARKKKKNMTEGIGNICIQECAKKKTKLKNKEKSKLKPKKICKYQQIYEYIY